MTLPECTPQAVAQCDVVVHEATIREPFHKKRRRDDACVDFEERTRTRLQRSTTPTSVLDVQDALQCDEVMPVVCNSSTAQSDKVPRDSRTCLRKRPTTLLTE